MKLARRLDHIEPFYVMECAKAAQRIAASPACDPAQGGERMLFLNIGEPDFTAPPLVQEAAERAIRAGRVGLGQRCAATALLIDRCARPVGPPPRPRAGRLRSCRARR